jgi:hypothetical protein
MDLENLNKSQIILLTLLVSFMTSIATGIVTVSLMEQAPPAITETVNRVVERTVERVVPGQVASAASSDPKTVVVRESELIPQAVEKVSPSVVRLYSGEATSSVFLGLGLVLDKSGTIVTDASNVSDVQNIFVENTGGMRIRAIPTTRSAASGLAYLAGATSSQSGPAIWHPVGLSAVDPVLGQTIVLISGKSASRIAQGLITTITPMGEGKPAVLETDLGKDGIMPGSPIISSDGLVLGISTEVSREANASGFVPATSVGVKDSDLKEAAPATQ